MIDETTRAIVKTSSKTDLSCFETLLVFGKSLALT